MLLARAAKLLSQSVDSPKPDSDIMTPSTPEQRYHRWRRILIQVFQAFEVAARQQRAEVIMKYKMILHRAEAETAAKLNSYGFSPDNLGYRSKAGQEVKGKSGQRWKEYTCIGKPLPRIHTTVGGLLDPMTCPHNLPDTDIPDMRCLVSRGNKSACSWACRHCESRWERITQPEMEKRMKEASEKIVISYKPNKPSPAPRVAIEKAMMTPVPKEPEYPVINPKVVIADTSLSARKRAGVYLEKFEQYDMTVEDEWTLPQTVENQNRSSASSSVVAEVMTK